MAAEAKLEIGKPKSPQFPLLIRLIAVAMSLFQLYTGVFQMTAMNQRVTHVTFGLVLIFLIYGWKHQKKDKISWDGYLLAGVVLALGIYVLCTWFTKVGNMGMSPPFYQLVLGGIFILLCMEASRRTLGWVFPIIAAVSMLYARFGEIMPDIIAHKNYPLERPDRQYVHHHRGHLRHVGGHIGHLHLPVHPLRGHAARGGGR